MFKSWMSGERSVLWISGNPGAGKSYIASNLISLFYETYPQRIQHSSHVSVAYFYFNENDPKTRSFPQALRDMAYTVAQNDQVYAKYLSTRLDLEGDLTSVTYAWKNFFADFFIRQKGDSHLIILLDGMDESFQKDREEFFDLARRHPGRLGRIRLVMLGRPQVLDEIVQNMDLTTVPTISVTPKTNFLDIARYIDITISRSASLRRVSKVKRQELAEKIREKAGGMVSSDGPGQIGSKPDCLRDVLTGLVHLGRSHDEKHAEEDCHNQLERNSKCP